VSRSIGLSLLVLALCGCESIMRRGELEPIESNRRVELKSPVTIFEMRGALKLQWQLLPGAYVERYQSPLGPVFESDGPLVEFTPTLGGKTRSVGGFIVLRERKGVGKLYVVRKGETMPHFGPVSTAVAMLIVGPPGDLSLVTDFPLSSLKAKGWR
jgi:hypothetical protein